MQIWFAGDDRIGHHDYIYSAAPAPFNFDDDSSIPGFETISVSETPQTRDPGDNNSYLRDGAMRGSSPQPLPEEMRLQTRTAASMPAIITRAMVEDLPNDDWWLYPQSQDAQGPRWDLGAMRLVGTDTGSGLI